MAQPVTLVRQDHVRVFAIPLGLARHPAERTRDGGEAFHGVYSHDGTLIERHRMVDAGECQVVLWLEQDPGVTPELAEDGTDLFEIGRFPIRPVWTGCGVEWQRVTG